METSSDISTEKACSASAFILISHVITAVIATIFGGFVLTKLWAWFIVPVFLLPTLSISQAIGVDLVVTILAVPTPSTKDSDMTIKQLPLFIFKALFRPLLFLFVGWIVTFFL